MRIELLLRHGSMFNTNYDDYDQRGDSIVQATYWSGHGNRRSDIDFNHHSGHKR